MSSPAPTLASRALVENARYELIPLKSVERAIEALPAASSVSVTCSPAKGIDATLQLAERIAALGHDTVPHISARLVEGRPDAERIAAWTKRNGIEEIFLVAGDAEEPAGPYQGAVAFLQDFLECDSSVRHIGVTSYPDGHPLIDAAVCQEALLAKQELLREAGVETHATTQMCFDTAKVRTWITEQRTAGVTIPFHLGIPGVVDKTKLLTLGVRLGIGQSLRFVRKNKTSVRGLLSPGGYDPSLIVEDIAPHAEALGITGLHLFTFNEVETTAAWQRRELA